jgi:hypothetical protein
MPARGGGSRRAARSPTIAADAIPACPAGKWRKLPQNRMAEKLQEIAGVGIPVRITNPRARFVKTLSRIGAHGRKPRRKDRAAVLCPPAQKRLTLPCGATPPFPYNQLAPPSVSKEVAAAILTQTYFQSIPKAAAYLIKEVESGRTERTSPESGATSALVLTYKQILETIEERRPDNDDREIHGLE